MTETAVVLFDGICNLCNGAVRFIIANDPARRFRFAPLQSAAAADILDRFGRRADSFESIVLVDGGRLYERSGAVLRIAAELRAPLGLARALLAFPQALRDRPYVWLARRRYRFFGRRGACALPPAGAADRFLERPPSLDASAG